MGFAVLGWSSEAVVSLVGLASHSVVCAWPTFLLIGWRWAGSGRVGNDGGWTSGQHHHLSNFRLLGALGWSVREVVSAEGWDEGWMWLLWVAPVPYGCALGGRGFAGA